MSDETFGNPVERLRLEPNEVLVVRPRSMLTTADNERLHRNLRAVAERLGIARDRIIVLDRDVDLSVVKADQMELV